MTSLLIRATYQQLIQKCHNLSSDVQCRTLLTSGEGGICMKPSPDHHTIWRMYSVAMAELHCNTQTMSTPHPGHGCPRPGLPGAALALNLSCVFSRVIPAVQGYTPSEVTALYLEVAAPQLGHDNQWVELLAWCKCSANRFI